MCVWGDSGGEGINDMLNDYAAAAAVVGWSWAGFWWDCRALSVDFRVFINNRRTMCKLFCAAAAVERIQSGWWGLSVFLWFYVWIGRGFLERFWDRFLSKVGICSRSQRVFRSGEKLGFNEDSVLLYGFLWISNCEAENFEKSLIFKEKLA